MATCKAVAALCQQQTWQARAAGASGRRGAILGARRLAGLAPMPAQQQQQQQQGARPRLECRVSPFDTAWGTTLDYSNLIDTLPQNLFAISIIPYAGFLYHLHRSKQAPPMMLFGFYFLLAFVFATIPAGIYAKVAYGTTLANVDWLHGGAESLLTVTNLFIVLGLRDAIRKAEAANAAKAAGGGTAAEERQPAARQE